MGERTHIAWCDSTFNPWIGCTKVSPGCDHCYAEALDKRHRWQGDTHWGPGKPRMRTSAANWRKPLQWNKKAQASGQPWRVFCASLADVFDTEVPDEWRRDLWDLIETTPHLTWLLLTKRISNALRMLRTTDWAASTRWNVWLGASVVNQEEADRDIPKLLATPARVRFLSYEPALGPIDFAKVDEGRCLSFVEGVEPRGPGRFKYLREKPSIDWVIVGGESSQGRQRARPFDIAWARDAVQQCQAAGVPVFVKQLGSHTLGWCLGNGHGEPEFYVDCQAYEASEQNAPCPAGHCACRLDRAGADPEEWPEDLRVQEWPA